LSLHDALPISLVFRPREVSVGRLWASNRNEVTQDVWLVAREEVANVDDVTTRGGELVRFHREVLARHHLSGKHKFPECAGRSSMRTLPRCREQFRRPDLRVEGDVVLAHEVVRERLGVVPPQAPRVWV